MSFMLIVGSLYSLSSSARYVGTNTVACRAATSDGLAGDGLTELLVVELGSLDEADDEGDDELVDGEELPADFEPDDEHPLTVTSATASSAATVPSRWLIRSPLAGSDVAALDRVANFDTVCPQFEFVNSL
jgi:hypothetical protein